MKKIAVLIDEETLLKVVIAALSAMLFFALFSCNTKGTSYSKNLNTGMITTGHQMAAEKSELVMNGEIINHTQIPLGESFVVMNDQVTGLTVKNGKVSAGCSLEITDSMGNVLLQNADLFEGNDVFEPKDASLLKCTISTGAPMQWDGTYQAKVVFWDKYVKGT